MAFIFDRCGIDVGNTAAAVRVDDELAGRRANGLPGAYYRIDGVRSGGRFRGPLGVGMSGARASYLRGRDVGGHEIDVRPGDIFWEQFSATSGHTGIIVGVHRAPDRITLVTVEGNYSDKLTSRTLTMTRVPGGWSSVIKGWGRPAALNQAPPPTGLDGSMPNWIAETSGQADQDSDERSTR